MATNEGLGNRALMEARQAEYDREARERQEATQEAIERTRGQGPGVATTPEVRRAIDTIAAHCAKHGFGSCVIAPTGGASFLLENILSTRLELYAEIERLAQKTKRGKKP